MAQFQPRRHSRRLAGSRTKPAYDETKFELDVAFSETDINTFSPAEEVTPGIKKRLSKKTPV
jgi:hypothetical protein